jgi:RNA polymerase sigma-70 factor (ECF subfamily)
MSLAGTEQLAAHRESLRLLARAKLPAFLWAKVDPSDLVHDTLLEAQKNWDQFTGTEQQLGAWLRQVLFNNLKDLVRKYRGKGRDVDLERTLAELDQLSGDPADSPSGPMLREEEIDRLAVALAQLPQDQRVAVELKHLQGLRVAEIAAHLGRTEVAVAGLLRRGLQRLRELMPEPV